MKRILRTPIAAAACMAVTIILVSAGCKDSGHWVSVPVAAPAPVPLQVPVPSPSITYAPLSSPIGTTPAGPTKEAPATTSPAKSEVSKADQSAAMPLPGQANDHSALLPNWTQKPKTSP